MSKRLVGIFLLLLILTSYLPFAFNSLVNAEDVKTNEIKTFEVDGPLKNITIPHDENITSLGEIDLFKKTIRKASLMTVDLLYYSSTLIGVISIKL